MEQEDVGVEASNLPKDIGTEHHETAIDFGHNERLRASEVATLGELFGKEVLEDVISKEVSTNAHLMAEGEGDGTIGAILLRGDDTCFRMGGKIVTQGCDTVLDQLHVAVEEAQVVSCSLIGSPHIAQAKARVQLTGDD